MVVHAMADAAQEPNYSMGDDTPIAPLGRTPRRLYNHLRQRFAQVTNPAIDSLREKSVMSLRVLIGARGSTLTPEGDAGAELAKRVHPAMASHERRFTHPLLKKTVRRTKNYHAHDENNEFSIGDVVWIEEHRPISRLKRWAVVQGDKRAK
jgi:small subunit ribosomal protein S17